MTGVDSRRLLLWLCRIWYTLVGGAAVAISVGMFLTALASGCRVAFDRTNVRSEELDGCVQHVDTPFTVVVGVAGLLLLCAAMWVNDRAAAERRIAAVGIGLGGLVGLLPAWWAVTVASYYGVLDGGELIFLLGVGSLSVIGICAAVGMAIGWSRAR
jgi:hypothetical protein